MSATSRAVLEWLVDRQSRAYTIATLAESLDVTVPKAQAALARLRQEGLVQHFEGDPGTWAVTKRGFAEIKFDIAHGTDRFRMGLEAIILVGNSDGYSSSKVGTMQVIAEGALS